VARYIKKFTRLGSAGPTEEKGFAIWAGYDIVGVTEDLSELGLINVEEWSEERLAELGITTWKRVGPEDTAARARLGLAGG
jgi:hypothetical protein